MKKVNLLISSLFLTVGIYAQQQLPTSGPGIINGPTVVITASKFQITKPLNTLYSQNQIDKMDFKGAKESPDREHRLVQHFLFTTEDGPQYGNDSATMQNTMGTRQPLAVITSFQGQDGGCDPQDPSGAPGLTKYVQAVNASPFAVYNKTGGSPIFTGDIGTVAGGGQDGDPIVLYDKFADRWFVGELNGNNYDGFAVAVSATNDPTGNWYAWQFTLPSGQGPDYLKFSVWDDGYYMTSNNGSGTVYCLERAAMLTGSSGARAIIKTFTEPSNAGYGFWLPLPGDADGVLPPAGQRCPLFSYTDNGWGGTNTDAVKVWSMGVTWGTTPAATITLDATLPTTAFDANYDQYWNDITQYNTTQKLDGLGGVCMYRAQWNSFVGTNRVVLNWAVKITSTHRSIKWVELRQDQTTNAWSLYQQGTYNPDSTNRWNGSIAMDCNGDIALCYAKTSSTIPVSLAYTGRVPTDPLGTMSLAETVVFTGTGHITSSNRFGDYSQTSIDPVDGNTFWHTGMYCLNGSKTAIYSFQIAPCSVGIDEETAVTPELTAYLSGTVINVKATKLPSNDENVVQLYDINGKLVYKKTITPSAKSFETTFDVSKLVAGIYIVRIGTPDFQKVAKVSVQ